MDDPTKEGGHAGAPGGAGEQAANTNTPPDAPAPGGDILSIAPAHVAAAGPVPPPPPQPPAAPPAGGEPQSAEVTPAQIADAITMMMAEAGTSGQAGAPSPAPNPRVGEGEPAARRRIGVLLVNLGTPEAADAKAVRVYLKEFLSDRRVIEKPSLLFRLVFRLLVLPLRPIRKARSYRKIWNREKDESPLKTITRAQAEKLAPALAEIDDQIKVDWAMRYGNPAIASRIDAFKAQGCERILVVPLYPQYSGATTATAGDEVFRKLMRLRYQPALRIAPAYYDDPVYIEALAASLRAEVARLDFEPEVILASFHGMPKEYVDKGDPYEKQCIRTTELLRHRLGRSERELVLSFQSRFGRGEWLQPYTDATIRALAKRGVKKLAVITPGFSADCLETLEEIALENAHLFKRAGGEKFVAIPCLNDSEAGMLVIRELTLRELRGWV